MPSPRTLAARIATAPGWVGDFVNHLARSDAQRHPNAALKLQLDVQTRVSSGLGTLARHG